MVGSPNDGFIVSLRPEELINQLGQGSLGDLFNSR